MDTEIKIRPVSKQTIAEYLDYFDNRAFADNPGWGFCYCHFLYADTSQKSWGQYTAAENRVAVIRLIGSDQLRGYLAYVRGKAIGWCNAAPRLLIPALKRLPGDRVDEIGSIVCFVIAKEYRHHGVASRLLTAACEGFREQGLRIAEAYPRLRSKSESSNHYGPLKMYMNAGFEVYRKDPGKRMIVRKQLG